MAVTQDDVAKRAGVSPAVVSYVLNPGSRPVSAAARARIEQAIRDLNYRPNAVARALRRASTMSIGLMIPDLGNPFVASFARSIEDLAYDLGYVLFVGTVGHDSDRAQRYLASYVDRQVDGLIIVGVPSPDLLTEMAAQKVPSIVIDGVPPGIGISSVVPEGKLSSEGAVRHLIDVHGHSRIGCIAGPAHPHSASESRVSGWRTALQKAGLPAHDGLLYRGDAFSRQSGSDGATALLDSEHPTAFFVLTDIQAVGAIGAVRRRGLFVPEDVAIVSYDGSDVAAHSFPGLTTVDGDVRTLAARSMSRLTAKLDGRESGETHDVIPAQLVIRRSCGCGEPAD